MASKNRSKIVFFYDDLLVSFSPNDPKKGSNKVHSWKFLVPQELLPKGEVDQSAKLWVNWIKALF